jgi:hypothetical protein
MSSCCHYVWVFLFSSLLSCWLAFFKLHQLFIVYLFFCPHPNIIALIRKPHLVIGVPMRSAEQEHLQKCLCPSEWNGVPMRSAGEEVEMTKQVQK